MKAKPARHRSPFRQRRRTGAAWIEILFVLAFLAILFQVFPSLWNLLWNALDVRQWSRTTWMAMNVVVVLLLVGIRFGPNAAAAVRERRKQLAAGSNNRNAAAATTSTDVDREARRRRDADWAKRAKKRAPWQ